MAGAAMESSTLSQVDVGTPKDSYVTQGDLICAAFAPGIARDS